MNVMEIENLKKTFVSRKGPLFRKRKETLTAVDGVSFHLQEGEIFSLLGPNGAGKTTTIKMLATLLIPTAGTAAVMGYDIVRDDFEVRKNLTTVMPGDRTLYWKLTVRENLLYFATLYGMRRPRAKERIETLLRHFRMEEKRDTLVEKLSTGQRQKVVLCRALMPEPRVILLDEPTLGLDPVAARDLRVLIRGISEQGTSVLLTTHYMYEADELSDRVAIINAGRIVCLDTPAILKESLGTGRIFRLHVDEWDENTSRCFTEAFTVENLSISRNSCGAKVEFGSSDPDLTIAEISGFCSRRTVEIKTIAVDQPSLEDVFVQMTGADLKKDLEAEHAVSLPA